MKKNIILIAFIFGISIASAMLGLFFGIGFFTNTGKNSKPLKSVFATETGAEYADVSQKGSAMFLDENARFTMSEGTISNHTTKYGGAIYISNGATFTMTGGTITGCTARYGGAIYVASGGTCIIEGGTITGNSATFSPSIYVEKGANLVVGGNAIIDKNTFGDYYETRWNFYVDEVLYKSLVFDFIRDGEPDLSQINPENPINGWFLDKNYVKTLNKAAKTDEELIVLLLSSNDFYTKSATMDKLNLDNGSVSIKEGATGEVVFPSNPEYSRLADIFIRDSEVTKIYFSDMVKRVVTDIMSNCPNLTELVIPDSISEINFSILGMGAFKRLFVPSSVTSFAFIDFDFTVLSTNPNSGSVEIKVDKDNTKYDSRGNCNGVIETATNKLIYANRRTIIPTTVEIISSSSFNISRITQVNIPKSVNTIEHGAFENCLFLEQIYVDGDNNKYDSRNNCNAIIETATNKLIVGCKNTKIPNSIVTIGESAFENVPLTYMIIPNSVTSIENKAFRCSSGSIFVPNSVRTATSAFSGTGLVLGSPPTLYCEFQTLPSGWNVSDCTVKLNYTLEQFKTEMGISSITAGSDYLINRHYKSPIVKELESKILPNIKSKKYI